MTEPTTPSAWLLVLCSQMYPRNIQRKLNNDRSWFKQSLSQVRQNQGSKRKAFLAGWLTTIGGTKPKLRTFLYGIW